VARRNCDCRSIHARIETAAILSQHPHTQMPRCHGTSASSSFVLFVVGEAGSPLWCHLRSERLRHYFSVPDHKGVGCQFIVVVYCFSTPDEIGIIALEDRRAHSFLKLSIILLNDRNSVLDPLCEKCRQSSAPGRLGKTRVPKQCSAHHLSSRPCALSTNLASR